MDWFTILFKYKNLRLHLLGDPKNREGSSPPQGFEINPSERSVQEKNNT